MYRRGNFGPRGGRGFGAGYGVGYGAGYGRGFGGRRFSSPYCDFYPDRPRGWWAIPEYQENLQRTGFAAPPAGAMWDPYSGKPNNPEAIEYEISMIQKQIEALQKDLEYLKSMDKPAK